jgi:hypothetical protein
MTSPTALKKDATADSRSFRPLDVSEWPVADMKMGASAGQCINDRLSRVIEAQLAIV